MIDDETIRLYREDGAVVLRGLLDAPMIERLRRAVQTVLGSLSAHGNEYARPGEARFTQDMFMAQRPDAAGAAFRSLIHDSPLAEAAGRLMGASEVRFFYDQMFVKEPGSLAPTPWHQDLPYWPLRGEQICG
ncbi:MAG: phytanoyl-CoA dioxygenase family protein, partial [Betaproteobacteria bacterium]